MAKAGDSGPWFDDQNAIRSSALRLSESRKLIEVFRHIESLLVRRPAFPILTAMRFMGRTVRC